MKGGRDLGTPHIVIPRLDRGSQCFYRLTKFPDPVLQRGDDFLRVHHRVIDSQKVPFALLYPSIPQGKLSGERLAAAVSMRYSVHGDV